MTLIQQEFHSAMFDVYRRAKQECGYNATRYLQMLDEHGGEETAHLLLGAKGVSEGYVALWECGRLDLTVEAVVLDPRWRDLFTEAELETARRRLREYGFDLESLGGARS